MEENISRFISAIIAVFLLFIFPVYMAYEKKDDVSYALALNFTQDFVDKVRGKGYVTKELYDDYVKSLYSSGNTYKIDLEHEYVSYDRARMDGNIISSNRNSEIYDTNHIMNILDNGQKYVMNVNDNFRVRITNTNITPATIIYNIITINMSNNNVRLHVDYGGKIIAEKWFENNGLYYSENGGVVDSAHAFNINITANDIGEGVDTQTGEIQDTEPTKYLSNYAKIGDYVDYPVKTVDGSKYNWRVIKVDKANNSVFIVSDTYYGSEVKKDNIDYQTLSVKFTTSFGIARNIKLEDVVTNSDLLEKLLSGKKENNSNLDHGNTIPTSYLVPDLVNINTLYWFSNSINAFTWHAETSNVVVHSRCNHSYSMRPVVELTQGIICTNADTGDGSQGKPWKIDQSVNLYTKLKDTNLKIGDYVKYTSDNGVNTAEIFGIQVNKNPDAKWRVFKIDNNKITLLYDLEGDTSTKISRTDIDNEKVFNNGVTELNNVCSKLYSDNLAKVRSINSNDIAEYMDRKQYASETITKTWSSLPKRFMNSDYNPESEEQVKLWLSTPYDKIEGDQSVKNINKTIRTYTYSETLKSGLDDSIKEILTGGVDFYHLATVYVNYANNNLLYGFRYFFASQNSNSTNSITFRPIMELDINANVHISGNGSKSIPWVISK